jgi:hypothetical protein
MEMMKHVTALGQALEEIEALMGKMGGCIDSGMEVDYGHISPGTNEGWITANPKLFFDLPKLHEYVAQSPRQDMPKETSLSMDGISESFKA